MSVTSDPHHARTTYVHLADDGAARAIEVTASFWPDLMSGKSADLERGRLVTQFDFDSDWDSWERHPEGEEVVVLLSGSVTFVLERGDEQVKCRLETPGSFTIIPRNTWHTAKTREPTEMLFITAGRGTEHRPV